MPRYSYAAMNQLALNDTGHFVFLSAWQYVTCLSILEQSSPVYLWADDQNPLTPSEIDDLQDQLAEIQVQLMTPLTGLIMPICTAGIPAGMLLCDGTIYQRADYPNLYATIDLAYIIDADSFMVPDLRDRFVMSSGPLHPDGSTGGSATHTMTIDELVPHSHDNLPHAHSESAAAPSTVTIGLEVPVPAAVPSASVTGSTSITIESTGGGQPMDILPPFAALRYAVVAS